MAGHPLPLHALRAFEAAARHVSYSAAADELHLTHGAISHQMRALEAELGTALFRRSGRRMVLTEAGQRLAAHVREGFQRLARGVEEARTTRRPRVLTVSAHPGLASRWLIPRLDDFQRRHPEIDVSLRPTSALADFGRDEIDMALRYGRGVWSGLTALKLMDEELFPVCSPAFNGGKPPRQPRELAKFTLLRDELHPWQDWYRSVGLELPAPARGPIYSDGSLLLQAAAEGHGIALARGHLARPEIEAGRLVRLFPRSAKSLFAYFIVYPPASAGVPEVAAFRDWLIERAREEGARKSAVRT